MADANGWLPAERREMALVMFKSRRGLQVRYLRARVADAQATLKSLKGQAERAKVHETLRQDQAHLAHWEQMASLPPECLLDSCAE